MNNPKIPKVFDTNGNPHKIEGYVLDDSSLLDGLAYANHFVVHHNMRVSKDGMDNTTLEAYTLWLENAYMKLWEVYKELDGDE